MCRRGEITVFLSLLLSVVLLGALGVSPDTVGTVRAFLSGSGLRRRSGEDGVSESAGGEISEPEPEAGEGKSFGDLGLRTGDGSEGYGLL